MVVIMSVLMPVVVTTVFVVDVIVAAVRVVHMVVGGIRVLFLEELRVDIKNRVQVKATDVDDLCEVCLAEVHHFDFSAGIDMHEATAQILVFGLADEILFRDEEAIGKANLLLCLFLLIERLVTVFRVNDRDHGIKAVVLGNIVVHEERLADRPRVGHAGGLNDHALEIQLAGFAALAQIVQRAHEITAHRAADAAVGKLDDFLVLVLHQQIVVDALGSELVFNDGDSLAVVFGQDAFEQRGFTCTEKSGENRDGDHFVQATRGIHESTNFNDIREDRARPQDPAGSDPGDAGLHHSERRGANTGLCGLTLV